MRMTVLAATASLIASKSKRTLTVSVCAGTVSGMVTMMTVA